MIESIIKECIQLKNEITEKEKRFSELKSVLAEKMESSKFLTDEYRVQKSETRIWKYSEELNSLSETIKTRKKSERENGIAEVEGTRTSIAFYKLKK